MCAQAQSCAEMLTSPEIGFAIGRLYLLVSYTDYTTPESSVALLPSRSSATW